MAGGAAGTFSPGAGIFSADEKVRVTVPVDVWPVVLATVYWKLSLTGVPVVWV